MHGKAWRLGRIVYRLALLPLPTDRQAYAVPIGLPRAQLYLSAVSASLLSTLLAGFYQWLILI